ncbi:phage baseplate plug protein, partial [Klebsiella pneumoniae]|uniref:phage baseplate plug family protein n=1 Tax=Klebsiella pneumoniae TaxID=573 RepID=UPI0039689134
DHASGLYADLYDADKPIFQGVLCLNCVYLVRYKYLGSSCDLVFVYSKGTADPYYDEIGTRFKLYYATSSEVGR